MEQENVPAMHPEFPRWYRVVSFADERERLHRRWAGLSALIDMATSADIETMVRIVFRTKKAPQPEELARVRQAFRDADDLFEMRDNDRELEVLCGAALAVLFGKGERVAAIAGLSVTTAAVGGTRIVDLPMDLEGLAEQAIIEIAEANRRRPRLLQYTEAKQPPLNLEGAVAKLREQPDQNGMVTAFQLAANAIRASIGHATQQSADMIAAVNEFLAIQDEELQMLWWLIGERSWDLNCNLSAVPADAQPLVFAKELAAFTQFLPGPASVKVLLARAGLKDRKRLSISAAVNACDVTWLTTLMDGLTASPATQPIHFAIQRKLETGDDSSWVAGWSAVAGIEAGYAVSAVTLGTLFYRERLLATFGGE